ncbi:hypothetical protein [Cytobacillus kochii]|uniref:hypothetical protein n=1 Tax=Cytobacillus kochii TaxID=859143 RepID=UPI00402A98E2
MYFINTNFSVIKPIGSLSENRISMIKSKLSIKFPEILKPNPNTLIFRRGASALIITHEQLTFATQSDESEIKINELSSDILAVYEALELSNEGIITLKLEGIEDRSYDTLETSKNILGTFLDKHKFQGVGYRFMINNDFLQGDIHVEPYIKDKQKIFFNIVLETKGTANISDVESIFNKMYDFGLLNGREIANGIFSN